jgi:hypothetical protein
LASRPDRRRLDVALVLAAIANRAYSVALVVYVYNETHSSVWVAAAAAARYLPGIVTSLLARPMLERFSARDVLVWADVSCAVAVIGMAAAILVKTTPAVPIALAALVRVAASGQAPAVARLLPSVAGGGDLAHVAARQAATDKVTLLVGPAIGGVLLIVMSPAVEMLVLAALVAVAAMICLGLPSDGVSRSDGDVGTARPRVDGRVSTNAAAGFGIFIAVLGLSGFVYGTDTVLLAVISTSRLHLGNAGYGELFAGLGAGVLIAAPAMNSLVRRHRLAGWLTLGMIAYCLPSVLVAHSNNEAVVVLLEAVRGAGSLVLDIAAVTELQRVVLPQGLTVLSSRLTSVVFGAVAAGAMVTPLILHGLDVAGALTVLGLVPPAMAVLAFPSIRRFDSRSAERFAELRPRIAVLEKLGLLQATSRPVLERLAADMTEIAVPAGTDVIVQGDVAEAFYVVRSGHLEIFVDGRRVNELDAGDWFGEIGLLESLPRTATVRTGSPTQLYRIGGTAFLEAFEQLAPSPGLLDSVASRLASGRRELASSIES